MKYLFIDDFKFKHTEKGDCFGLCFILIDHTKYNKLKNGWNKFLKKIDWPNELEFKGRYIFDGKGLKGDLQTAWKSREEKIIKHIDLFLEEILSGENRKFNLHYYYVDSSKSRANYEKVLSYGLKKILNKKIAAKEDKNYCGIFIDSEQDIDLNGIFSKIYFDKVSILEGSGHFVKSSNNTPGILLADLYAYFAQWYLSNMELPDINLFSDPNITKKVNIKQLIEEKLNKNDPTKVCVDCNLYI
jgi:hypothetical protein